MDIENSFSKKCYKLLLAIPKGKVTTYKYMAEALNCKAYRAVGTAMAKNKNPIIIPCHRVVKSDGRIGEFALGKEKKIELLKNEGIFIKDERIVDFQKVLYKFDD